MLQAVRGGHGPEHAVRAYLLTTVRRVAAELDEVGEAGATGRRLRGVRRAGRRAASEVSDDDTLDLGADVRAMHEAEQSMAMQAFRSLPERWQAVLWHTEVEDESPSEVATALRARRQRHARCSPAGPARASSRPTSRPM